MSKKLFLAAALAAAFAAVPALAQGSCGSAPLAPAIPAPSDLAGKTGDAGSKEVIDAYHQVKAYQDQLKPYRDCLSAQEDADKKAYADAQTAADKDKMAAAQDDMTKVVAALNATVDTETQVANAFNALHMEDCKTDTNPHVCPKH